MEFFSSENFGLIETACAGMYAIAESKPEKFNMLKEPFRSLLLTSLFCAFAYGFGYMQAKSDQPDITWTAFMIISEILVCLFLIEKITE